MSTVTTQAPAFNAWLDDVLNAYYRAHPVNATFIGVHRYDDRLPDLSDQGLADVASESRSLLQRMASLPNEPLTTAENIDRQLAAGFLAIEEWEHSGDHTWRANPSLAISEAVFGVISLFLREFAPLSERVESAIARMEAIPTLLAQAQDTIQTAPAAWSQRAIRESVGTLELLAGGVELLIDEHGITNPGLGRSADRAKRAVRKYRSYLRNELLANPRDSVGCGEEALDLLIGQGHMLEHCDARIEALAWGTLRETEQRLEDLAQEIGVASWRAGLAQLSDVHPTEEKYEQRFGEIWQAARNAALEHHLLTWPDYPIRYVPRPNWVRKAAPYLYFLFYRAPAAFDSISTMDYLIAPLDRQALSDDRKRFLRANNDGVIKLNHVVHHGGIGHHVQNWHAYRAESHIGQIAAVDGASRIAMLCGGTMAEGWACYASELMEETGFYSPLERLSLAHTRLRMAARAIVDVRLHTGKMTLDEAARFYQEKTAMSSHAAHQEAVKNSMFPAAALMYLVGTDLIWQLRRDQRAAEGYHFNLHRFHDEVLSFGSIPVALIAKTMESTPHVMCGYK